MLGMGPRQARAESGGEGARAGGGGGPAHLSRRSREGAANGTRGLCASGHPPRISPLVPSRGVGVAKGLAPRRARGPDLPSFTRCGACGDDGECTRPASVHRGGSPPSRRHNPPPTAGDPVAGYPPHARREVTPNGAFGAHARPPPPLPLSLSAASCPPPWELVWRRVLSRLAPHPPVVVRTATPGVGRSAFTYLQGPVGWRCPGSRPWRRWKDR